MHAQIGALFLVVKQILIKRTHVLHTYLIIDYNWHRWFRLLFGLQDIVIKSCVLSRKGLVAF